jgi:hypothetical protein
VNQSQIYSYAKAAGLPDAKAQIAAAIAMAESGGNASQVTNDSDDYSFGLWQINMKGSMGPSRRALYGLKKNEDLLDPTVNARVMSEISHQGQSFGAWTTYTTSDPKHTYKRFMGTGVSLSDLPSGAVGFLAGSIPGFNSSITALDTVTKIGGAVTNTARWVSNPKNWVRVVYVLGGIALVYAGVEAFILPAASSTIGKVAGVVGPGGKVAKVAGAAKNLGQKATS